MRNKLKFHILDISVSRHSQTFERNDRSVSFEQIKTKHHKDILHTFHITAMNLFIYSHAQKKIQFSR